MFALVGCNPKEKPKELTLLSFDNMVKSKGYNVSSKGELQFDIKKMASGDNPEQKMFHDITSVSFDVKSAFDKEKHKTEMDMTVNIPYKQDDLTFRVGLQGNEKEKTVIIDNDTVMATLHSLWKFAQHYNLAEASFGMQENERKEIENVLSFLDKQLANSYTSIKNSGKYLDTVGNADSQTYLKEVKEFVSVFPEDAFQYEKDKKGQYGHIVLRLDDKTLRQAITDYNKKQKNEADKLDEEFFFETVKTKKMEFHILVNEEKQMVSLTTDIDFEVKDTNESSMTFPLSISMKNTFSDINKPKFDMPKKEKRMLSEEQVQQIITSKMADIEKKQMESANKQPAKQ